MIRRLMCICLVVVLGSAAHVLADTGRGSLSVRVHDANGAVPAQASVRIRGEATGLERSAMADDSGVCRFDGLPTGRYRITASATGFSSAGADVDLDASDLTEDLTLAPGTIAEEVTVTASRTGIDPLDTAVPVTIIGRERLERRPLATIGDLFRELPGTSTASEGPFQIRPRIRGLDSNRVLILVDGERLNNARTSTSNSGIEVGLVDLGQIESVEVTRGSGSVLYGTDALAGTINIISRDTPGPSSSGFRVAGGVNGYVSSNESGRRGTATLTGAGSRFAFRISQTLDRFDNYHSGAVPTADGGSDSSEDATEVANSGYHGSNTQLVGRFFMGEAGILRASYERRRAADIGVPAVTGTFNAFFPFSDRDKVSVRYDLLDLTPALARITASAYYQNQERNFTNILDVPAAPPFFPGTFQFSETITQTRSSGFDLQTNWTLGRQNLLTAGTSYFRDHNEDERLIERLSPNFQVFPPTLVRSEERSKSVPDADFSSLAFFVQDEFRINHRIRIVGGIRVDRFSVDSERTPGFDLPVFLTQDQIDDLGLAGLDDGLESSEASVTGDVGVVVTPIDGLSLTARVGRSFREPNLFERFFTDFGSAAGFVVGNPALVAESGINVDIGAKLRTRHVSGSFAYFNNTYDNFLTNSPAVDRNGVPITVSRGPGQPPIPVFQTVNTRNARLQGVEGDIEVSIPTEHIQFAPFASVSTVHGDDLDRDVPLDFVTPLKLVGGLRIRDARDRAWFEYGARVVTTQDRLTPAFLAQNGGPEAGFVTHEITGGANWRFERWNLSATVGIANLGNRYFSEQFTFAPARGRSVVASFIVRFE